MQPALQIRETDLGIQNLAEKIGGRVRQLRMNNGWSQEYLAEKSNLHKNYIGNIENGKFNISVLVAAKIASALNTKISELVDH